LDGGVFATRLDLETGNQNNSTGFRCASDYSYIIGLGKGLKMQRVVLRGGNWSDGTIAGVFATTFSETIGGQWYTIGFRCASDL